MYPYPKRKKFPSQIKYEQNNPTITFRMKKHEKELIQGMADNSGKSISELIRVALLDLEKDFTAAYEKRYLDGFNDASTRWGIWFFCSTCNEEIFVEPNSDAHNAIIEYMKEHNWVHRKCSQKKRESSEN